MANVRGIKLGLPKEYFKGLASETGDLIQKGDRHPAAARLRDARGQPAGHGLRDRLLLHHLHGGGEFESGSL